MNQPDGDIYACWFSIVVLTSLSQSTSTNPISTQVPFIWFCIHILWVSITSRPFTLTPSNGIACHERRTRSRSRKCSARVCTDSPIDASLAPMSGRMESSAAVSVRALSGVLQSPWNWAKTNIWNVYTCQYRLIYILLMPGADFQILSSAAKFYSNKCNAFLACFFNLWVISACKIPLWGLTFVFLMRLRSVSSSEEAPGSVPEILWTGMMRHTAQGWDFPLTDETGEGDARWRERLTLKIAQGITGDIRRLVEVAKISKKLEQKIWIMIMRCNFSKVERGVAT